MKKIYEVYAESFGINGENPEGDGYTTGVVAKDMETAIKKFRSNQPKSLHYTIIQVEVAFDKIIV